MESYSGIQPVIWRDDDLYLLDQRVLPREETELRITDVRATAEAITDTGSRCVSTTVASGNVAINGPSCSMCCGDLRIQRSGPRIHCRAWSTRFMYP